MSDGCRRGPFGWRAPDVGDGGVTVTLYETNVQVTVTLYETNVHARSHPSPLGQPDNRGLQGARSALGGIHAPETPSSADRWTISYTVAVTPHRNSPRSRSGRQDFEQQDGATYTMLLGWNGLSFARLQTTHSGNPAIIVSIPWL